jgi:hypothetical protein
MAQKKMKNMMMRKVEEEEAGDDSREGEQTK